MHTTRWTVACVVFFAFASGCGGDRPPEPRYYPILDSRGLITYTDQEPQAPTAPKLSAAQQFELDAKNQQRQRDELYDRSMAAFRQGRDEQRRLERQEQAAYEDMTRGIRQAQASQERRELQAYQDREADRRLTVQRGWQERSQAEATRQQEWTRAWLKSEQLQQRRFENQFRSPDFRDVNTGGIGP